MLNKFLIINYITNFDLQINYTPNKSVHTKKLASNLFTKVKANVDKHLRYLRTETSDDSPRSFEKKNFIGI